MTQMNLSTNQKQTYNIENTFVVAGGRGGGKRLDREFGTSK